MYLIEPADKEEDFTHRVTKVDWYKDKEFKVDSDGEFYSKGEIIRAGQENIYEDLEEVKRFVKYNDVALQFNNEKLNKELMWL